MAEQRVQRRLAAILAADVVGSRRFVGRNWMAVDNEQGSVWNQAARDWEEMYESQRSPSVGSPAGETSSCRCACCRACSAYHREPPSTVSTGGSIPLSP